MTTAPEVTVDRKEREWITHTGPYPFVCNINKITWTDHTTQQIIEHHAKLGTAISMRIVRKLMGEIE